jgi:hypothetical protein
MKASFKSVAGSLATVGPPIKDNQAGEGGQSPRRLIPVLRKKRADWCIPRMSEQQVRQAELDELKHLQELFRGTTPAGRDLYRKILCGIRNRLKRPGARIEEVIAYARSEFRTFASLEAEFKQLYLMHRSKRIDPGLITLDRMATVFVIVERLHPNSLTQIETATGHGNGCLCNRPSSFVGSPCAHRNFQKGPANSSFGSFYGSLAKDHQPGEWAVCFATAHSAA